MCTPGNPQSLFFNLILTLAFPRGPPLSEWQVDVSSSELLNILNPTWPVPTTQILLSSYLLGQSAVHSREIQTLASEWEMRDKKGKPQERWVHLFWAQHRWLGVGLGPCPCSAGGRVSTMQPLETEALCSCPGFINVLEIPSGVKLSIYPGEIQRCVPSHEPGHLPDAVIIDWMFASSPTSYVEALTPTWWYLKWGLWELITVRVGHEGGALTDGLKRRGRGREEVSLLAGTEKRPCEDGVRR